MGSGLESWCGKVEANLKELSGVSESSVQCSMAPAQPGWVLGCVSPRCLCKGEQLGSLSSEPQGSGLDMTTFFFLCWMFEGKARGWYLSFRCRKWIVAPRGFCHGACLSRWKKDANSGSPHTFESLVYQKLQTNPAGKSIHRCLFFYTVSFLDQN